MKDLKLGSKYVQGVHIVFFPKILKYFGVSVCTHIRQVEHQRCSRTGRVQENHIFKEKTQYLINTLYIISPPGYSSNEERMGRAYPRLMCGYQLQFFAAGQANNGWTCGGYLQMGCGWRGELYFSLPMRWISGWVYVQISAPWQICNELNWMALGANKKLQSWVSEAPVEKPALLMQMSIFSSSFFGKSFKNDGKEIILIILLLIRSWFF